MEENNGYQHFLIKQHYQMVSFLGLSKTRIMVKDWCLSSISVMIFSMNISTITFNPFPHKKILDQAKLKAFADNKLNVTKLIISVCDRIENIVGKGEIACTSNFSFAHNVLKRLLS